MAFFWSQLKHNRTRDWPLLAISHSFICCCFLIGSVHITSNESYHWQTEPSLTCVTASHIYICSHKMINTVNGAVVLLRVQNTRPSTSAAIWFFFLFAERNRFCAIYAICQLKSAGNSLNWVSIFSFSLSCISPLLRSLSHSLSSTCWSASAINAINTRCFHLIFVLSRAIFNNNNIIKPLYNH